MKWRQAVRRFGFRFAISLVVLGLGSMLVFGWPGSRHRPITPSQKLAVLRAALDQSYLAGSTLSDFSQNNVVSYSTLSSLQSGFATNTVALQAALKQASHQITPSVSNKIQTIIARQQHASTAFTARYTVLSQTMTYDPTSDFGSLNPDKDSTKLAQRATAAQNGLKRAATDTDTTTTDTSNLSVQSGSGPMPLVDSGTAAALLAEADCLGQLAAQANAKQTGPAGNTRTNCIKNYPPLRQKIIQNVLQPAFDENYQSSMKNATLPLLKQLDGLTKTATAQKQ